MKDFRPAEHQTGPDGPCDVCQILDAMNQDCCIPLTVLGVDGGMTGNRLLMQLQADILCIPVGKKGQNFWEPVLSWRTGERDLHIRDEL